MTSISGQRILVVGAGVVGSAIALDLARHGAQVMVADSRGSVVNASRVAAGMLAPAMEAVLDAGSADHLDLLRRAQALWPAFAQGLPIDLHRCGSALIPSSAQEHETLAARLLDLGICYDTLSQTEASELTPGLEAPGPTLFTPEDWRLDAPVALDALQEGTQQCGVHFLGEALVSLDRGAALSDGSTIEVDAVVLATGLAPRGVRSAVAELKALRPIRGQLVSFPGCGPAQGAIVRAPGGYLVPGRGGLVVGATMEEGAAGLEPDPEVTRGFVDLGRRMFPSLADCEGRPAVGVRSATPDGLPLVGASSRPGVFLALGARRNGWLLAPLIAQVLRAALCGDAEDTLFDPARVLTPS